MKQTWTMVLVVLTGMARLIPHPWNATPTGAMALFGGSRMSLLAGLSLPLLMLIGTDAILWAWKGWSPFNPVVYGCFVIYGLLGHYLLRKPTVLSIVGVSILASVQFFLLTNFAVWWSASLPLAELGGQSSAWVPSNIEAYPLLLKYSADVWGLLACYTLALPFYWGTLAGDLIYPLVVFGLYAALTPSPLLRPRTAVSPSEVGHQPAR